jgi:hypothetical protein
MMAKPRPSVLKRQREQKKRDRKQEKAEKRAQRKIENAPGSDLEETHDPQ